jgi:hypothetical protein
MTGKLLVILIAVCSLIAGVAMYYLQVYAFYEEVQPVPGQDVVLMPQDGGEPLAIAYGDFRAIDADSSPIRYRACFTTTEDLSSLKSRFTLAGQQAPRVAPGWFDCFDAKSLGKALDAGTATAFISRKNVDFGVDRIIAITSDGRGYAWHELNKCGEKAYDGTVVGEECPKRERGN